MKALLPLAAIAEAATGLALLVDPSLVGRVLLGVEFSGVSVVLGRVAGIALIALGIACGSGCRPLFGMLTYSALVTIYLGIVAFRGQWVGPLLWPAIGLHAVLTILLARAWWAPRKAGVSDGH
jgi:hypothetical protein